MFSVQQKRKISDEIQTILRETRHPELPENEIKFEIYIEGAENWSWADIQNNGSVTNPSVNCGMNGYADVNSKKIERIIKV